MQRIDLTAPDAPVTWVNVVEFERSRRGISPQRVHASARATFAEATAFRAPQAAGVEIRFSARTNQVAFELTSINSIGLGAGLTLYHGKRLVGLQRLPSQFKGRVTLYAVEAAPAGEPAGDWRILLPYGSRVFLKALYVDEGCAVTPGHRRGTRWLAHGDSITQGARAQSPGATYVARVADALHWDAINLGFGGSAWGDAPVAEYLAWRDDWDLLSIAIGTNTFRGERESAADFGQTYDRLLTTVRERHPHEPILCITPIWRGQDADGWRNRYGDTIQAYRDTIAQVVNERADDANVHLLDGLSLIGEDRGLVLDQVHPDDHGMAAMAQGIVGALEAIRVRSN